MWLIIFIYFAIITFRGVVMVVSNFNELQSKIDKIDNTDLFDRICRNIKKIRQEKYNEFKKLYKNDCINPYTTESIAELLDYNHTHYKRFESETDSTKRIPLEKIVLLSLILDTSIDELIK